jgi:pyruvate-ferredoxin/flavodoxin oxidoreductase
MSNQPPFPGIRITATGNQLVSEYTEARVAEAGVFYPITPSTEMGEIFQQAFANGKLNVFGRPKIAIETEGEHAAQGGAIAVSVTGKRTVNFTSGQGLVYGLEQYYHAPGKLSTLVVQIAARALTKHALNVHCGHDDFYAALDTGWIMLMARDAQQAADQTLILRKVCELSLTPGMNIQDGFLTSHLERTFLKPESDLLRTYLGAPEDIIECPTEAQRELFGPTRRRVPKVIDLKNPVLLGPVQNQEHYMNGVVARRNHFAEAIPGFIEQAYAEFAALTGRHYSSLTEYMTQGAETVFFTLGCAAENIEAASDYLSETRGERFGSIHLNILRPFPEEAVVEAMRGRKNVIILERTDEPLSGDNPLTRDVRTALLKAVERGEKGLKGGPAMKASELPRIFSGSYGIGSRDFRPEAILGAYEFATGQRARRDGATAADGTSIFTLGIAHPYSVESDDTPSLLPDGAISIRLHSIGGWGMITTGKNLGAIISEFGDDLAQRRNVVDDTGNLEEVIHISANPKYGSEKKGAPTNYFLVVAPKRIRVNCDLKHVDVVLCCDPKAFTHANPLEGIRAGGAFIWESDEGPERAWQQIPMERRREIVEKGIRVFTLPGFDIARKATDRGDLQLRMQGNSFLGGFFKVSSFLKDYDIGEDRFQEVVRAQYVKKFGRFGDAVVESNMTVMKAGFSRVTEVPHGPVDAPDISDMRGNPLLPAAGCNTGCAPKVAPAAQEERPNLFSLDFFDNEYRAGHGYHQPASPLSAVGVVASAAGAQTSKYVARRETPVFIPENCTQCMECIAVCPDTALPNTAQDIDTVLETAVEGYVSDTLDKKALLAMVPALQDAARLAMNQAVAAKEPQSFSNIVATALTDTDKVSQAGKDQLVYILDQLPLAYNKTKAVFSIKEKKVPGDGGIFSIFVSDLCKGCGACVTACGSHEALKMVPDSEKVNEDVVTTMAFLDLLGDTEQKYLGRFDAENPWDAKAGVLRNHLMVRRNYDALVSGDGACAGCGEKSVLRALATVTEAYMRPLYHQKSARLTAKATRLEAEGLGRLRSLQKTSPEEYTRFRLAVAHIIMDMGGESMEDTLARIAAAPEITDQAIVDALVSVMRQDAFNHREIQANDGRTADGMSVMAMGAHTGCNTVFGSTPPNNPHPYPWMNSLFQDGSTIGWMFGETFIMDHSRRSVIPERLSTALLEEDQGFMSEEDYFNYTHFSDGLMTDDEIRELPKAWVIGGDGGMGDIGFQNVSKVVLQNRPNVKLLMLDTQVYSNTGGQNSDSSPMPGGGDMNALGDASQGKMSEKKSVAEILTAGHGSPFVAQLSMANATRLYRSIIDGLNYRGTAFFQCFTTCQPEHGVADDSSEGQARKIRDSRGMPDFVFDPQKGETYTEALDLKGNPNGKGDWASIRRPGREDKYLYTIAHWAHTEARFRRHFKRAKADEIDGLVHIDDMLIRLGQQDTVYRRFMHKDHRSYVPDFGVYCEVDGPNGTVKPILLSRQMVLFCVERRKAWRMLQSKAGVINSDYVAHRSLLAKVDAGEVALEDFLGDSYAMFQAEKADLAAN